MNLSQRMQNAVSGLRWDEVKAHLERVPDADLPREIEKFLDVILRDGYLVVRRPDADRAALRDNFLAEFRAFAAVRGVERLFEARAARLQAVRLTEGVYQEVLSSVNTGILSRVSPAQLVWAAVRRCEDQTRNLLASCQAPRLPASGFIDPVGGKIHVDSAGGEVNPDQYLNTMMRTLTSTIKMLAYNLNWFAADGAIEVPPSILTEESHADAASGNEYLAAAWHQIERSDGRCRYFNGTVTKSGGTVRFDFPNAEELEMHVAGERLKWMFMNFNKDLADDVGIRAKLTLPTPVPLPPDGFISLDEAHAALALSHTLFKWVGEVQTEYGGLAIVEWLRGYAVLNKIGTDHLTNVDANVVALRTARFLEEILALGSLTGDKAKTFIRHACMARNCDDVFDTPLLRCADGHFYLIHSAAAGLHPYYTIMSRLASLRCDLSWKGKTLESDIVELFRSHGIPAAAIKRKIDSNECEVDCVVLWDGILFVFECKNYSLPSDNPQHEFWFLHDQDDAARQARTKAEVLGRHPEVIAEDLGVAPCWTQVVPVVLNGPPYSRPGPIDGVFHYDSSALHRFFQKGEICLRKGQNVVEGTTVKFWAGTTPAANDLLNQLRDPAQTQLVLRHFSRKDLTLPISNQMAVRTIQIVRNPVPID